MGSPTDRRHPVWFQIATSLLAITAGGLVYWLSVTYFPYHSIDHREAVYLQQAALLLEGQLALVPPVADVFQPWLFTPAGDGLYPPATPLPAAMFGVGRLVGGSFRLSLALIAAGNVLLVSAIVTELFDSPAGIVAGGLLIGSPLFLIDSAVFLPYAPTMLWILLFVYAYLLTVRTDSRLAPVLAGVSGGLAAFAQFYSTAIVATPIAIHAGYTLARAGRAAEWRRAGRLGLIAAVAGLFVGGTLLYRVLMPGVSVAGSLAVESLTMADGIDPVVRGATGEAGGITVGETFETNRRVLARLFIAWTPLGILGTVLMVIGLGLMIRRIRSVWPAPDRQTGLQLVVAGIGAAVILGNLPVVAKQAMLGDPTLTGDGVLPFLGPYHHFELLLPVVAFGAHGLVWVWGHVRTVIGRLDPDAPGETAIVVGIIGGVLLATVGGSVVMPHLSANDRITEQYADAYGPVVDRSLDNALVFLPTPHTDRLNRPFQYLRNEPGFDGPIVYAIDAGPRNFDTIDAFPDRRTYRYVYRGRWAPTYEQGIRSRLQPVDTVGGREVRLRITFGIPSWIEQVSIHLSAGDAQRYYGLDQRATSGTLTVVLTSDGATVTGDTVDPFDDTSPIPYNRSDYIGLDIFLNAGTGGGASYRALFPVRRQNGTVRTMTPYLELCRSPSWCGGEAAYLPDAAPEGLSIETSLSVNETADRTARLTGPVPGAPP
ncbi:MAG: hypothetical protein ABEH65_03610 [Halobacteriales archaeon]